MKLYRHLSPIDRGLIHLYLAKGESIRSIGKIIERPASTVSREIQRNRNKLDYKAVRAHSRVSCNGLMVEREEYNPSQVFCQDLKRRIAI